MSKTFVTQILIKKVRHLQNIEIPLSEKDCKHLLITGKNGSGKTSLLEALKADLAEHFNINVTNPDNYKQWIAGCESEIKRLDLTTEFGRRRKLELQNAISQYKRELVQYENGAKLEYVSRTEVIEKVANGSYITAYFPATRTYKAIEPKNVEKIQLADIYLVDINPGENFIKYLLDLKTTEALAEKANKPDRANAIGDWFISFEGLLREIYEDPSLKLDFDIDSFMFTIHVNGRVPFSLNQMSSGYSAIFDIVVNIMMRMEKHRKEFYDIEGLVLIDEIETHLHIELQKKIMPFLTKTFPNIQFIVSTHSPFVLHSISNAVVYDLEKRLIIENGLGGLPYDGIIEGFFNESLLSSEMENNFRRYKELAGKHVLTNEEREEIAKIEFYLDEVPDYLSLGFNAEYQRLKLEFRQRG